MDEALVVGRGVHDDGASGPGRYFDSITEAGGIAWTQPGYGNSDLWEPGYR